MASSAYRRYFGNPGGDFEVFLPRGGDTLHRWSEIWRKGVDLSTPIFIRIGPMVGVCAPKIVNFNQISEYKTPRRGVFRG